MANLEGFVESTLLKLVARVVLPAVFALAISVGGFVFRHSLSTMEKFETSQDALAKAVVSLDTKVKLEVRSLRDNLTAHEKDDELVRAPMVREADDHEARIRLLERAARN